MKKTSMGPVRNSEGLKRSLLSACVLTLSLAVSAAAFGSFHAEATSVQTFTGYITTEDDFAAGLKKDTADMVHMKMMAESGLGITFQQGGRWVFYFFDGTITSGDGRDGSGAWAFDGKGSQLSAWNLVAKQVKAGRGSQPAAVTVAGELTDSEATNPGSDKDGRKYRVIDVKSFGAVPPEPSAASSESPADGMQMSAGSAPGAPESANPRTGGGLHHAPIAAAAAVSLAAAALLAGRKRHRSAK